MSEEKYVKPQAGLDSSHPGAAEVLVNKDGYAVGTDEHPLEVSIDDVGGLPGDTLDKVIPVGGKDPDGKIAPVLIDAGGNVKVSLDAVDITVTNLDVTIGVTATPTDPLRVVDSVLVAGTTDGAFPPDGPNTTAKPFTMVETDMGKFAPIVVARNSANAELASEETLAEVRDALVGDEAAGNVLFIERFNSSEDTSLEAPLDLDGVDNKAWIVTEADLIIHVKNGSPFVAQAGSDTNQGVMLQEVGKKNVYVEFTLTDRFLNDDVAVALKALDYNNSIQLWQETGEQGAFAFSLWPYDGDYDSGYVSTKTVISKAGDKLGVEIVGTIYKFYLNGTLFDTLDLSVLEYNLTLNDQTKYGFILYSEDSAEANFTDFKVQAFKTDKAELQYTDPVDKTPAIPTREVESTNPDIFKRISEADLALSPIIWDDFKRPDSTNIGNGWVLGGTNSITGIKDNKIFAIKTSNEDWGNVITKDALTPNCYVEFDANTFFLIDEVELVLRMQDIEGHYIVIYSDSNGTLTVANYDNATSFTTPYISNLLDTAFNNAITNFKFGVSLNGNILKVYINRELKYTVDLSTTTIGTAYQFETKFGLVIWHTNNDPYDKYKTSFLVSRYAPEEPNTIIIKQKDTLDVKVSDSVIFHDDFDVQDDTNITRNAAFSTRGWKLEPETSIVLIKNKYPYVLVADDDDEVFVDAGTPNVYVETTLTQRLLNDDIELTFRANDLDPNNNDNDGFLVVYFSGEDIKLSDWNGGNLTIGNSTKFAVGDRLGIELKDYQLSVYINGEKLTSYTLGVHESGDGINPYINNTLFGFNLYGADASEPTIVDYTIWSSKPVVAPSNLEPKDNALATPVRQVGVNKVTSQDLSPLFIDRFDRPELDGQAIGGNFQGELDWQLEPGLDVRTNQLGIYVASSEAYDDMAVVDVKEKDVYVEFEATKRFLNDDIEVILRGSGTDSQAGGFSGLVVYMDSNGPGDGLNINFYDWNTGSGTARVSRKLIPGAIIGLHLKGDILTTYIDRKYNDTIDLREAGVINESLSHYGTFYGVLLYGADGSEPNFKDFAVYKFAPEQSKEQEVIQKATWQSGIKHDVLFQENWNQGNGWDITAPMTALRTWEVEPNTQIVLNGNNPYPSSIDDIGMAVVDVGQHDIFLETTITQRLLDDSVELSLLVQDVNTFEDTSFVEVWFEVEGPSTVLLFYDWSTDNFVGAVISADFVVGAKLGIEILGNTLNTYVNGQLIGKLVIPPVSAGYTDFGGRTRHGINFYDNPDGNEPNFLDFVIKPFKQDLAKVTNKELKGTEYGQVVRAIPATLDTMPYSYGEINISSSGETKIVPFQSGMATILYGIRIVIGGDTTLRIKSCDDRSFLPDTVFTAGSTIVVDPSNFPQYICGTGTDLVIISSNAVPITGHFYYRQEVI